MTINIEMLKNSLKTAPASTFEGEIFWNKS